MRYDIGLLILVLTLGAALWAVRDAWLPRKRRPGMRIEFSTRPRDAARADPLGVESEASNDGHL